MNVRQKIAVSNRWQHIMIHATTTVAAIYEIITLITTMIAFDSTKLKSCLFLFCICRSLLTSLFSTLLLPLSLSLCLSPSAYLSPSLSFDRSNSKTSWHCHILCVCMLFTRVKEGRMYKTKRIQARDARIRNEMSLISTANTLNIFFWIILIKQLIFVRLLLSFFPIKIFYGWMCTFIINSFILWPFRGYQWVAFFARILYIRTYGAVVVAAASVLCVVDANDDGYVYVDGRPLNLDKHTL